MIVHGLKGIVGQKKVNENNVIDFLPGLPEFSELVRRGCYHRINRIFQ